MKKPASGLQNNGFDQPGRTLAVSGRSLVPLFAFFAVSVLFSIAFFTSCKNDVQIIRSLDFVDTMPELMASDVEIIYSEKGNAQVKLVSPKLVNKTGEDHVLIFPEGFMVYFYDSLMNLQSTIRADFGISYEKKKLMEARHNVVVENIGKDETLNTEELFWDQQREVIYSEKFVKITSGGQVITGIGLTSVQPFNELEILQPRGPIEVREDL